MTSPSRAWSMSSALTKSGVLSADRPVHAVEGDLARAALDAGRVENGLERHAPPARIAHGAVAQLPARDARIEKSAAVARALVHRHDIDGTASS